MRRALILLVVALLVAAPAGAGYRIYLKNGSVIKGILQYEERGEQIMLKHLGGTISVPASDVDKIESVDLGVVTEEEPRERGAARDDDVQSFRGIAPVAAPETQYDPEPLKRKISSIDAKLARIQVKDDEYLAMLKKYNRVRLRIENLFQLGIKQARAKGAKDSEWLRFLKGQEREWIQINTLKKNDLKKKLAVKDTDMVPLRIKRAALLQEKAALQEELALYE